MRVYQRIKQIIQNQRLLPPPKPSYPGTVPNIRALLSHVEPCQPLRSTPASLVLKCLPLSIRVQKKQKTHQGISLSNIFSQCWKVFVRIWGDSRWPESLPTTVSKLSVVILGFKECMTTWWCCWWPHGWLMSACCILDWRGESQQDQINQLHILLELNWTCRLEMIYSSSGENEDFRDNRKLKIVGCLLSKGFSFTNRGESLHR